MGGQSGVPIVVHYNEPATIGPGSRAFGKIFRGCPNDCERCDRGQWVYLEHEEHPTEPGAELLDGDKSDERVWLPPGKESVADFKVWSADSTPGGIVETSAWSSYCRPSKEPARLAITSGE